MSLKKHIKFNDLEPELQQQVIQNYIEHTVVEHDYWTDVLNNVCEAYPTLDIDKDSLSFEDENLRDFNLEGRIDLDDYAKSIDRFKKYESLIKWCSNNIDFEPRQDFENGQFTNTVELSADECHTYVRDNLCNSIYDNPSETEYSIAFEEWHDIAINTPYDFDIFHKSFIDSELDWIDFDTLKNHKFIEAIEEKIAIADVFCSDKLEIADELFEEFIADVADHIYTALSKDLDKVFYDASIEIYQMNEKVKKLLKSTYESYFDEDDVKEHLSDMNDKYLVSFDEYENQEFVEL